MKMTKFVLGLTPLFLLGCGGSVSPTEIRVPVEALTAPTVIEGPVKSRRDAETTGQLWNFAGQAEAAVLSCNLDKELLREGLQQPQNEPTRRWWEFWK